MQLKNAPSAEVVVVGREVQKQIKAGSANISIRKTKGEEKGKQKGK